MVLKWTFWLTAENEPGRHYQTALSDCALTPEGQEHDSLHFMCRALPMLGKLEKLAVPHSMGAREVAKHPAGWKSAAGEAER